MPKVDSILVLVLLLGVVQFDRCIANESLSKAEYGKKIYLDNCVSCHGIHGDGKGVAARAISGPKPRNFIEGRFKYGRSVQAIFNTITKGVPGTAMPPWGTLSEKDRWAVVAYVKSLKK